MAKLKISCVSQGNQAVIRIDGLISEWSNSAAAFKMQVDTLVTNGIKNVKVYINSAGGDVFQADEISNEIARFPGESVAHLGALCASAATIIACRCNKVIAAKNVSYMFHKPSAYIEGNSDEVKANLKLLENKELEYAQTYTNKTGLPITQIQSMWKEDYWMNATEALRLCFIDEIEDEVYITSEDIEMMSNYKSASKIAASLKVGKPIIQVRQTVQDRSKWVYADYLQNSQALNDLAKNDEEMFNHLFKMHYKLSDEEKLKACQKASIMAKDRSSWTYDDYRNNDIEALQELMEKNNPKFEHLFNAHYKK